MQPDSTLDRSPGLRIPHDLQERSLLRASQPPSPRGPGRPLFESLAPALDPSTEPRRERRAWRVRALLPLERELLVEDEWGSATLPCSCIRAPEAANAAQLEDSRTLVSGRVLRNWTEGVMRNNLFTHVLRMHSDSFQ